MLYCRVSGPAPWYRPRFLGRSSFCLTLAAYAVLWLPPSPKTLGTPAFSPSAPKSLAVRSLSQPSSPYWLLVTFAGADTPQNFSSFNTSSFSGIAVQIDSAYDTGQTPALQALETQFGQLHAAAQRDIWPWVFINRMLGTSGMDLTPGADAQSRFLSDWRAALTVARVMQSPGVVLDLEFYNDTYIEYAMSRFAEVSGMSAQQASQLLQGLGKTLADIAQETYPGTKIWVLESALDTAQDQVIDGQSYFQPRGEIAVGLLRELAALNSQIQIIDGGESSLGYCHSNLSALQNQILLRQSQYASTLAQYGTWLNLGGTITIWTQASSKTGWLTQGDCGSSEVWGITGFTDYFTVLDGAYHYNWLYGAQAGGYDPFDPTAASQLTSALQQATLDSRQSSEPNSPVRLAHRGSFRSALRETADLRDSRSTQRE